MAKNKFTLIPTTPVTFSVGDIVTLASDGQAYFNNKPVARIAKPGEPQVPGYEKKSTASWFNPVKVAAVYARITTQTETQFGAEAYFVPLRKEAQNGNELKSYKLGGLSAQNPQKTTLMKKLMNGSAASQGIPLVITLQAFGGSNTLRANFPDKLESGASCGEVIDADDALITFLTNNGKANATAVSLGDKKIINIHVDIAEKRTSQYEPLIDDAVARCIAQAPDIEARVKWMTKSRFDPNLVEEVLSNMSESKGQIPNPKQKYYQTRGDNLSDLVAYMLLGKMVRLVGEKGSGKNTLIETACWLLNRPLCRVQGSSELDKMDLLGSRTLKDGSTGFEISNALETLRDGGIVVIDEVNTVCPEVLTILHSLTDGARAIDVPGYGRVEMDKRSCILYTMNEDYIGTGEMNAATIDRGPTMVIEQEMDLEVLLKEAVPEASPENIKACCRVSDEIHRLINQPNQDQISFGIDAVTIRGYIDALQAAKGFIPLRRALIQNVANKAQSELEKQAISAVIDSLIG